MRIGVLAQLHRRNGHEWFIDALAELRRLSSQEWTCSFAGIGPEERRLRELVDRNLDLDGVRHIIQPSANYVYVPRPNHTPDELPMFDYELPSLRQLPIEYPGSDQNKAAEVVAAALQAHPDLKGIYTTHSNAAVGTSSAVIGAGLGGKVKIIAYDADPQQVRDLKAGVYDALVVQSPYLEGYNSVKLVTQILRGEVDPTKLDDVSYPPMVVATRDNLDSPEVKKGLYVDACP